MKGTKYKINFLGRLRRRVAASVGSNRGTTLNLQQQQPQQQRQSKGKEKVEDKEEEDVVVVVDSSSAVEPAVAVEMNNQVLLFDKMEMEQVKERPDTTNKRKKDEKELPPFGEMLTMGASPSLASSSSSSSSSNPLPPASYHTRKKNRKDHDNEKKEDIGSMSSSEDEDPKDEDNNKPPARRAPKSQLKLHPLHLLLDAKGIESDGEEESFLLLPDEVWLMIFAYLSLVEKSRCALVCHHFWKWSSDRSLYRMLDFSPYSDYIGSFRLTSFASQSKTIDAEVLILKGCENLTDKGNRTKF